MSVFYNIYGNVSMFFKKRHALFFFFVFSCIVYLARRLFGCTLSIWRVCRLFGGVAVYLAGPGRQIVYDTVKPHRLNRLRPIRRRRLFGGFAVYLAENATTPTRNQ